MFRILLLLVLSQGRGNLDPDFNIPTEAGKQAFREELLIAMANTPGANAQTRAEFRLKAAQRAENLFREGQKLYKLPHRKLTIRWDSTKLDEIGIARSDTYEIHLSEVMFFTYYQDYLDLVIPHEVAHLLHQQKWGIPNRFHDESFDWMVKAIAPNYAWKDLNKTPACRLLQRLVTASGYTGPPVCE